SRRVRPCSQSVHLAPIASSAGRVEAERPFGPPPPAALPCPRLRSTRSPPASQFPVLWCCPFSQPVAQSPCALNAPLLVLSDLLDRAFHVEVAFCDVIVFAFQDFLETTNRLRHGNLFTLSSGEDLRHTEGLAQKALNLARTKHRKFVLGREFIHPQDGDDVLQVFVALKHLLHSARCVVVFLAYDFCRQGAGGRSQGIHCWVDTQFGNRALQYDGGV